MIRTMAGLAASAVLLTACGFKETADLMLVNGKVVTMNDEQPVAEAVAIRDGRIVSVGTNERIRSAYVAGKTEDLQGALVLPGLIDAHMHLLGLGRSLQQLDLSGTADFESVVRLVADRARFTPKGSWIKGRGWDQNDWPTKSFPSHHLLSAATREHYVYLSRVDGHAVLVNENVMKRAGITRSTSDPPGGKILRDATGHPTGVLVDNAIDLITPFLPVPTMEEDSVALTMALQTCVEYGLTTVHDAGVDRTALELYKRFAGAGRLQLRVYAMLSDTQDLLRSYFDRGPEIGLFNHFLTVRAVKLYADGALGSRGAMLLEPYSDAPGHTGLALNSREYLQRIAGDALRSGFQLGIHAIGDRGNRTVLDVYEQAFQQHGVKGDSVRFRIEHAQVLSPPDIPRFPRLGVIPSMQPTHCTSDMYWAEDRLGPARVRGAYAWRTLMKTGAHIAFGSDAPVESPNPLWGIYAAVTRQDHNGFPQGGWYASEHWTIMEALRGFTINAAYAAFEENLKGSIEPDKLADLVVLSKDITTAGPHEILQTRVVMTIVHGRVVHRAK